MHSYAYLRYRNRYIVSHKKQYTFDHNFGKCRLVYKFFFTVGL